MDNLNTEAIVADFTSTSNPCYVETLEELIKSIRIAQDIITGASDQTLI